MDDDPLITPTHIARAGFCASGLRAWCKEQSLDMHRIFRGQARVSEIEHLNDAHANRVIAIVRGEQNEDKT